MIDKVRKDSSTLVERVIFILFFSALSIAAITSCINYLDGNRDLAEYLGFILGAFVFTPVVTLLISMVFLFFAFIGFGVTGRENLQRVWIGVSYFIILIFGFIFYYLLYDISVWEVLFVFYRSDDYFGLIIILMMIILPSVSVYVSSFLLTEETYLSCIEKLNNNNED